MPFSYAVTVNTSQTYKMRLLTNTLKPFSRHFSRRALNFDLNGIFVPIPTPYQKDGNIDYGALAANFERWEKIPFKGNDLFSCLLNNGNNPQCILYFSTNLKKKQYIFQRCHSYTQVYCF